MVASPSQLHGLEGLHVNKLKSTALCKGVLQNGHENSLERLHYNVVFYFAREIEKPNRATYCTV